MLIKLKARTFIISRIHPIRPIGENRLNLDEFQTTNPMLRVRTGSFFPYTRHAHINQYISKSEPHSHQHNKLNEKASIICSFLFCIIPAVQKVLAFEKWYRDVFSMFGGPADLLLGSDGRRDAALRRQEGRASELGSCHSLWMFTYNSWCVV